MRKSSTVVSTGNVTQFYLDMLTEISADAPDDDVASAARTKRERLSLTSQAYLRALAEVEEFLETYPYRRR